MENNLQLFYSVLKYIPSSIRMESIIVGLAVHSPQNQYSEFFKIKNTSRVSHFDDEYNKDFFKMTMDSLRFELNFPVPVDMMEISLGYEDRFSGISNPNFLQNSVSYLSNEFRFSAVQSIITNQENLFADIDDLKRTFLYYDRPKSERITSKEVKKILAKQMRNIEFQNFERNPIDIKSDFSNQPVFDYKIGDKYVKAISFDYANAGTMAKQLKSTLYDIHEIISERYAKEIILATNETTESEQFALQLFKTKINKITSSETKTTIKIVPISEVFSVLN